MRHRNPYAYAGVGVLVVAAVLLLFRLDAQAFQDYDEATYAEITHESIVNGNALSMTFLNNPYFRKPPLLFWLTSASARVIPNEEAAMRFPSALAALALIALIMCIAFEASGSMGTAALAGTILVTTGAFIEPARQVRFDVVVLLFIIAAFYAGIRATRDARWYLLTGIALGLAILTKGIIAGFALIALVSYALLSTPGSVRQRLAFLKNSYVWFGTLACIAVAAPWHLYETVKYGTTFWQSYVGNEVVSRLGTNLFAGTNAPTNEGYAWYLLNFGAPWTEIFCAVLGAFLLWKRDIDARMRAVLASSCITALSILIVMGLSRTKAISYLIPFYPFMALTVALGMRYAYLRSTTTIRMVLASALAACCAVALSLTVYNAFHLNPYYQAQDQLAQEEKMIGKIIRNTDEVPAVYEYRTDTIGSIQYYAALPFTDHPFVLLLSDTSVVQPGSFIVTTVSSAALAAQFPDYRFVLVYVGSDLSLFRVDSFRSFASNIRFRT